MDSLDNKAAAKLSALLLPQNKSRRKQPTGWGRASHPWPPPRSGEVSSQAELCFHSVPNTAAACIQSCCYLNNPVIKVLPSFHAGAKVINLFLREKFTINLRESWDDRDGPFAGDKGRGLVTSMPSR